MMTIDFVVAELGTVRREDLEEWIAHQWVLPEQQDGQYLFVAIDIARARLIAELRQEMAVNDEAIPIILSLLDQLYDLRRRIGAYGDAARG